VKQLQKDLLSRLNSATIADVLDAMGVWGTLDRRIVPSVPAKAGRFIGRAYTTRWAPVRKPRDIMQAQPSTWADVKAFLAPGLVDAAGRVYVAGVDDGLCFDYALAGGLSATDFNARGFSGVVLGGAIRDAHVLARLPLDIRATNLAPADTQGNYRVVESGGSCLVGRVSVATGDVVFADETGVVVIPQAIADEVIATASAIESVESDIVARLESGERLFDIVNAMGRI
jgi:regulator of RNase E activity RraA